MIAVDSPVLIELLSGSEHADELALRTGHWVSSPSRGLTFRNGTPGNQRVFRWCGRGWTGGLDELCCTRTAEHRKPGPTLLRHRAAGGSGW